MSAEDEFMCLNEIFKMKLSPGKSRSCSVCVKLYFARILWSIDKASGLYW